MMLGRFDGSRLALEESAVPKLTAQLESILGYVAKICEADVEGVEPMAHAVPLSVKLVGDGLEPFQDPLKPNETDPLVGMDAV